MAGHATRKRRLRRRRRGKSQRRRRHVGGQTPPQKFIAFGCWNQGGCSPAAGNDLSRTMQRLREYSAENKQDFMVVLGDNYYPAKTKTAAGEKVKNLITADLASGFECLSDIPIGPKYVLLGNHELEQIRQKDGAPLDPGDVCPVLIAEKSAAAWGFEFYSPNQADLPHLHVGDQTLILFLDTNPYEDDPQMLACYGKLIAGRPTLEGIKAAQAAKALEMASRVAPGVVNIVFMAHHPLYSVKYKPEDGRTKTEVFPEFAALLQEICGSLPGRRFFHICADVHQIQTGDVRLPGGHVVRQIVVGTGGAEKDAAVPRELWKLPAVGGVEYTIDRSEAVNGFLQGVAGGGGELEFEFIGV